MVFTFSGTIAQWIDDDWQLVERLIDFHAMGDKEHAGAHAAKAFVRSAAQRGGLDKISMLSYLWGKYVLICCISTSSLCA